MTHRRDKKLNTCRQETRVVTQGSTHDVCVHQYRDKSAREKNTPSLLKAQFLLTLLAVELSRVRGWVRLRQCLYRRKPKLRSWQFISIHTKRKTDVDVRKGRKNAPLLLPTSPHRAPPAVHLPKRPQELEWAAADAAEDLGLKQALRLPHAWPLDALLLDLGPVGEVILSRRARQEETLYRNRTIFHKQAWSLGRWN